MIEDNLFKMEDWGFGKRIGDSYDVIARNAIIKDKNDYHVRIITIAGSFIMN